MTNRINFNGRAQVAGYTRFPVQINYIMRKTDSIFQSQVKKLFLVTKMKQYVDIALILLQNDLLLCKDLYKRETFEQKVIFAR